MSATDTFTRVAAFGPEALTRLGRGFDETWQKCGNFRHRESRAGAHEARPAILLELAKDGQFTPAELVRTGHSQNARPRTA